MNRFALNHVYDYEVFDWNIASDAEEKAIQIRRSKDDLSYYLAKVGMPEKPTRVVNEGYTPIEVVHRQPKNGSCQGLMVIGLPMANPLDAGQIFQAAAIADVLPDYEVLAVGNPSGSDHRSGILSKEDRHKVRQGNLRPVIDPILKCIDDLQPEAPISVFGGSYGADVVTALARYLQHPVSTMITMEPASADSSYWPILAYRFKRSEAPFKHYVKESNMGVFDAARHASLGAGEFIRGIVRLSNLAIASYIGRGEYADNVRAALEEQPDMVHSSFWAEQSEFGNGEILPVLYDQLGEEYPGYVFGSALKDQRHAVTNHIPTMLAVVMQGIANRNR